MLPRCCLCPCWPWRSPLPGSGHTLSLHPAGSLARAEAHLPPSTTERWGERAAGDGMAFLPTLPSPPESCLLNCWKWSSTSRVTLKKIPVSLQSQRWTFESNGCCILWEGMEDLCPRQTWAVPGKDIEKNYRSAVSLHKSDKGCGIINTCAHPPSLKLFFILISDFKRLIS